MSEFGDLNETIPQLTDTIRPVPITGAAVLTKLAFDGVDLNVLLADYQSKLDGSPADIGVALDISTIFQLAFQREAALEMQLQVLSQQQLFRVVGKAHPGAEGQSSENGRGAPPLRVLALVAPGDLMVNTPIEFILSGSAVRLDFLYLLPDRPLPPAVPDHDVAFVAVSEPDDNAAVLRRLRGLVASWPRPVINHPDRILPLSRESVYRLLRALPGLTVPVTLRVERNELIEAAEAFDEVSSQALDRGSPRSAPGSFPLGSAGEGFSFPLVVRPIGSHAGTDLRKVDDGAGLSEYLRSVAASEFYLMPFIDYRGADGLYRKYRIVFIAGVPYLCHMAVSENWMIHYLNAGMTENAAKRQEEASAMASFDQGFAHTHREALRALCDRFALEYFGIDCGETPDGRLLVFEVDVAMVIHDMDPPALFPYKSPQMRKVFAAFEHMLEAATHRNR